MTPHFSDDHLTVYAGDVRDVLPTIPAASVHCVVTSPPYWGLRDYGTAAWEGGDPECKHRGVVVGGRGSSSKSTLTTASRDGAWAPGRTEEVTAGDCRCGARRIDSQLGLEPTPEEYVADLVAIFREVRRALRDDGTVWLNLGDSYAGSSQTGGTDPSGLLGYGNSGTRDVTTTFAPSRTTPRGLKPKDLVGIPWRVAFALQADGWYLRSDIIWSKPNPMPESVTDRPTKSHEYVFLLTKSARYYFDAEAVREPHLPVSLARIEKPLHHRHPDGLGVWIPPVDTERMGERFAHPNGRNIRTVWTIATQPYPGAHFATFPEALVEPCVKAGSSERGVCATCGAPWEREVVRDVVAYSPSPRYSGNGDRNDSEAGRTTTTTTTTGWRPTCRHDGEPVGATVLDPFGGSGTTARVANRLGRRAVLIELNPEYIDQAMLRNAQAPLGIVG